MLQKLICFVCYGKRKEKYPHDNKYCHDCILFRYSENDLAGKESGYQNLVANIKYAPESVRFYVLVCGAYDSFPAVVFSPNKCTTNFVGILHLAILMKLLQQKGD